MTVSATLEQVQVVTLEQVQAFVDRCQAMIAAYDLKHFPNQRDELKITRGKRYYRIVKSSYYGTHKEPSSVSAWAFVDQNGDILLPANWKAPAKHSRGNILDKYAGMKHVGPYGVAYLR